MPLNLKSSSCASLVRSRDCPISRLILPGGDQRSLKCSPWDLRGESLPAQDPTQTTGWSMEDASFSRWPGGYLLQTVEAQVYEVARVHLYFPDTVGIVGVVSRVEWAGKVPTGTE